MRFSWIWAFCGCASLVSPLEFERPQTFDIKETATQWSKSKAPLPTFLRVLELAPVSGSSLADSQRCAPAELSGEVNGLRVTLHPLEISLDGQTAQVKPLCFPSATAAKLTFPFERPSWYDPGGMTPSIEEAIAASADSIAHPHRMRHTFKGRSLETLLTMILVVDTATSDMAALIAYPSPDDSSTSTMVKRVMGSHAHVLEKLHPALATLPDEPTHMRRAEESEEDLIRTFDARVKGAGRNTHDMRAVEELATALMEAGVRGVDAEWREVGKRVHQLRVNAPDNSPRALGQETWAQISPSLMSA